MADQLNNNVEHSLRHNKVLLEWRTPEFIPHPRGKIWFIIAGILILSFVIYAILTNSATTAIVFIILTGVYYLTHNQEPRIISIKITELGISIDKNFYPYNTINSFWIVYHPPFVRTLNLRLGTKSFTQIKIELSEQNPVEVRQFLAKEIPEIEGAEESMIDILIRLLRLQ